METTFRIFEIKTGPLSEAEIDHIIELAEAGMKSWSIARQIKRHPSSVAWICWRMGYKRLGKDKKSVYLRRGVPVVAFSEEEDAFILEKRVAGHNPVVIAKLHAERFPDLLRPRSRDAIATRLMMLASDEAVREEEAA